MLGSWIGYSNHSAISKELSEVNKLYFVESFLHKGNLGHFFHLSVAEAFFGSMLNHNKVCGKVEKTIWIFLPSK
jgi:hypothetical protein